MEKTLAITLGYRCNFNCAHCIVGEKREAGLSETEKNLVVASVIKHGLKHILFIGGEPTPSPLTRFDPPLLTRIDPPN